MDNASSSLGLQHHKIKAAECIIDENEELKAEVKKLRTQVIHWKNATADANQVLRHIGKQGTNRYADSFYDPVIERTIKKLSQENRVLVDKLNEIVLDEKNSTSKKTHSVTEYIKINNELKESVQKLKKELEQKYKDNRRLEIAIKNIGEKGGEVTFFKGLQDLDNLTRKCSTYQEENRRLKEGLLLQQNTMDYVKSIVDSLRLEFVELFAKCFQKFGPEFLEEMKTLDTKGLPKSLLQPLQRDFGTMTMSPNKTSVVSHPSVTSKSQQNRNSVVDSGYDEELQYLTMTLRNTKLECESQDSKIKSLQSELEKKEKEHQQFVNELLVDIPRTSNNEQRTRELQHKLAEMESELASWKTALKEKTKEATYFSQQRDDERRQKEEAEGKFKSLINIAASINSPGKQNQSYQLPPVAEPHHSANWFSPQSNIRDIVVADGPTATRPKRQSSEPTLKSDGFSMSPKKKSPLEASAQGDQYWSDHVENVLQCEYCKEMFPCSLFSEHLRTCTKRYQY